MPLWLQQQLLMLLIVPCIVFVPVAADVCLDGKHCGSAQCCLYSSGWDCCRWEKIAEDSDVIPAVALPPAESEDSIDCSGPICLHSGEPLCCPAPAGVCCTDGRACCAADNTCITVEDMHVCYPEGGWKRTGQPTSASPKQHQEGCMDDRGCPKDKHCQRVSGSHQGECQLSAEVNPWAKVEVALPTLTTTAAAVVTKAASLPWEKQATSVSCANRRYCPGDSTCCRLPAGSWGCCGVPNAVCCADGVHCCPAGHVCMEKYCMKSSEENSVLVKP
uniref:Progranulin S2 n=1 Tax=Lethenteron reissneri TaxID=7753 RepID=A0A976T6D2_LETRI|nr:progranulin precursor S2 [Lethenteron reissneri]